MPTNPRYVGQTCYVCNNAYSYDPVPMYITLIILVLTIILLGFMYVKYLLARKETEICMSFRRMNEHTKHILLLEDG